MPPGGRAEHSLPSVLRIAIVTPVFNDWASFRELVKDLGRSLSELDCSVEIVAVDDCSTETSADDLQIVAPINKVRVLSLASNLGHQRAIAIGLSSLVSRKDIDLVAVMDSDGEDQPRELVRLIRAATAHPGVIVVGRRARRSEGPVFRVFYHAYKALFWLLTGKGIDFGNFCVIPFAHVGALASRPEIWNHFAATIVRARLPLNNIPTARGSRYAGASQMNFISLIVHGLGAISVFSELVFVRILLASLVVFGVSAVGILAVVAIRLFTDLATPGWATSVFGFLLLIGIQAVMMPVMMAFMLLNGRATVQQLPKDVAAGFVREERVMAGNEEPVAEPVPVPEAVR